MNISKLIKEQIAKAPTTELEEKNAEIILETKLPYDYITAKKIMWKLRYEAFLPDLKTSTVNGNTNLCEIELSAKLVKVPNHYN